MHNCTDCMSRLVEIWLTRFAPVRLHQDASNTSARADKRGVEHFTLNEKGQISEPSSGTVATRPCMLYRRSRLRVAGRRHVRMSDNPQQTTQARQLVSFRVHADVRNRTILNHRLNVSKQYGHFCASCKCIFRAKLFHEIVIFALTLRHCTTIPGFCNAEAYTAGSPFPLYASRGPSGRHGSGSLCVPARLGNLGGASSLSQRVGHAISGENAICVLYETPRLHVPQRLSRAAHNLTLHLCVH